MNSSSTPQCHSTEGHTSTLPNYYHKSMCGRTRHIFPKQYHIDAIFKYLEG